MSNTFSSVSVNLATCQKMGEAAIAKAIEIGITISLTIVDGAGNVKYYIRMDNAPLIASDISRKKAITAVGFGMPTGEAWHNFIKDDPILNNGVQNIQDFMLLGGGMPIMVDNQLAGAVGVSGAHYSQDEACATAALSVL
jgi:uncharacterized protein GlcG (DUF336 family)